MSLLWNAHPLIAVLSEYFTLLSLKVNKASCLWQPCNFTRGHSVASLPLNQTLSANFLHIVSAFCTVSSSMCNESKAVYVPLNAGWDSKCRHTGALKPMTVNLCWGFFIMTNNTAPSTSHQVTYRLIVWKKDCGCKTKIMKAQVVCKSSAHWVSRFSQTNKELQWFIKMHSLLERVH